MLDIVLARAVADGIIEKSPVGELKGTEKPKYNKEAREYLQSKRWKR